MLRLRLVPQLLASSQSCNFFPLSFFQAKASQPTKSHAGPRKITLALNLPIQKLTVSPPRRVRFNLPAPCIPKSAASVYGEGHSKSTSLTLLARKRVPPPHHGDLLLLGHSALSPPPCRHREPPPHSCRLDDSLHILFPLCKPSESMHVAVRYSIHFTPFTTN